MAARASAPGEAPAAMATGNSEGESPAPGPRGSRLSAVALALAGLLLLGATYTPWWVLLDQAGGTSSSVEFYPGASLSAGGGGGGGAVSYASVGLSAVGQLYAAVFAVTVLVALLAFVLSGVRFARTAGRWIGSEGRQLLRIGGWVAFVGVLGIALAVPLGQPALLRLADPQGFCAGYAGSSPCASFWSSTEVNGDALSWGAGLGWWLGVTAAALLGLVAFFAPGVSSAAGPRRASSAP